MSKFDDLRRQAEHAFGKDAVRRVEREILSRKEERSGGVKIDRIISVEKVDFSSASREIQRSASKSPAKLAEVQPVENPPMGGIVNEPVAPISVDSSIPAQGSITSVEPSNPTSTTNTSHSATLIAAAIRGEYIYGTLGIFLGLSCILGGIVLGLRGVTGSTSWTAKLLGLESSISDAAPGVVLFIVGIFLVWITKPKIKMKDLRG